MKIWNMLCVEIKKISKQIHLNLVLNHLQRPYTDLPCFQGTFYAGVSIFNSCLKNEKAQFKVPLRRFLNTQSFYSVDEFVLCKDKPSYCT